MYKDRESQIRAINKTFDDVKKEVKKHYTKPGVVPLQEMPVFPDSEVLRHI